MPEKKKQHYVPKLLLRYFACDAKKSLINVFNANTNFYRSSCPLKTQAQEDYFYGKDGVIEDGLGKIETTAAPIISKIVEEKILPKRGTKDHEDLFLFTMLLEGRTKNNAEHLNEMVDKMFQEIKKSDSRFKKKKYEDLHLQLENAAAFGLSVLAEKVFIAYDLELALLVNQTEKGFITSDHPAVSYNQFLEVRNHPGGHHGLVTKGLQIFLPISPNCMLVLYDKWAYKLGNKKDNVINVTNTKDIEQLNYLQIVNCTDLVFSNNLIKEHELILLSERSKLLRSKDRTKLHEINKRHIDDEGNEHVYYTQHADNRKIKLNLSFVKQTQHAKSHKLNNYAVQFRNEQLRHLL